MLNKNQKIFFLVSLGIFISASLLYLFVGPYRVGTREVLNGIVSFLTLGKGGTPGARVVLELRIPRMILALLAGGSLAVCGSIFQTVLGNPLADPYILGVSGGAAVGAVLSFMVSRNVSGGFFLPLFAFLGAAISAFAVYALAGVAGKRSRGRLILTGVIVAAFMNAIILLLISVIPPGRIPGALFWLMGDLSNATPGSVRFLFPLVLVSTCVLLLMARGLDIMLLGDETALQSGLEVERFKTILFVVVSFQTGAVVSISGLIGFVGLIIPHVVRKFTGSLHGWVICGSFLLGGSFLVVSDVIARSVLPTGAMPIGAITALFGAPFFIYILRRRI